MMPAPMRTKPENSQVSQSPTELSKTTMVLSTAASSMADAADANRRRVSTMPRATLARSGGLYVNDSPSPTEASTRRMRSGGDPHQLAPDFVFFGVEESTATSEFFANLRPGAVIPEFPTKERLPTFANPEDIQPPPSS